MAPTDPLIALPGGAVVRSSTAAWLIAAGFRLSFDVGADGRLHVRSLRDARAEDNQFIRAHRDELIAVVAHIDRQVEVPL